MRSGAITRALLALGLLVLIALTFEAYYGAQLQSQGVAPHAQWLLGHNRFELLVAVDFIVFLFLLTSLIMTRKEIHQDLSAVKAMFGGHFRARGAFRRAIGNPITITCAVAFILAVGIAYLVTARVSMSEARGRLAFAASDMREAVSSCADNLLFYQGKAIVNHYHRPEAMTADTVQELMHRYGLDELNVVNEKGIVLAGALADIGYDMGSKPLTAKFNCLLEGVATYSQDFRSPVEIPDGPKRKYAGVAFPPPAKGYVQLGFSEDRLKNDLDFWFEDAAKEWHIGKIGYYVIADADTGYICSCGREGWVKDMTGVATLSEIGFDVSAIPRSAGEFFTETLFGEQCLCLSETCCYHRIVSVMPISEITNGGKRTVLASSLVLLAVFIIVIFFMTKLSNLVISLKAKEREEKLRQERDLAVAKTIQFSSLPVIQPDNEYWKIYARMDTAREVGGDFYDFYRLPSGRMVFLVADVSGKGVPAALFMMRAKATLHSALMADANLAEAVATANSSLAEKNDAEMFVTAWIGTFDPVSGSVEYVNAGHNPPLCRRADGSVEWLRARGGMALAAMDGMRYRTQQLQLGAGDSLLLYTDGVSEAMNAAGELYGEARLEATLRMAGAEFVEYIRVEVSKFVAGAEPSDDITMLALDVHRLGEK